MKVVKKPWGQEVWIAYNGLYVLKIITLRKGFKTSLQYHREKHETNYIDSGRVLCTLGESLDTLRQEELGPGSVIEVPPGRVHRLEALEEVRLIEVSTPQVDDVVRLQDDFNRPDGRIESEHRT